MLHEKVFSVGKAMSVFLAIGATGMIIILTVVRWKYNIPGMDILLGYASIFVILQSTGIFSLFDQNKGNGWKYAKKILVKIDECSFGIYLVHMIFVKSLLAYMKVNPYEMGGSILAGTILLTFGASYLIVWVLRRCVLFRKFL